MGAWVLPSAFRAPEITPTTCVQSSHLLHIATVRPIYSVQLYIRLRRSAVTGLELQHMHDNAKDCQGAKACKGFWIILTDFLQRIIMCCNSRLAGCQGAGCAWLVWSDKHPFRADKGEGLALLASWGCLGMMRASTVIM